jgi:hypothetical protein
VELHSQDQRKDELVKPTPNMLTKLTQWTNWKESTLDSLELESSCFVSRVPMRYLSRAHEVPTLEDRNKDSYTTSE